MKTFKKPFSKRQWAALFGGYPSTIGNRGQNQSTLLTGLLDYWSLNESSGNRLSSVSARAMVPVGSVSSVVGKIGNCTSFATGTNYLASAADASLLSMDWSVGFTVCGWIYVPSTMSGRYSLIGKTDLTNDDWFVLINQTTFYPSFNVFDSVSGLSGAGPSVAVAADAWHFFCGRYNPLTKKPEFSIDGGAWNLGSALTNGPKNTKQRFAINRYAGGSYVESVDDVGIWLRYLSDAEVAQLHNGGAGLAYPF